MFSLVKYTEDGIIHVCPSKDVKKFGGKISVRWLDKNFYFANVLFTHQSLKLLQSLQNNIDHELPRVAIQSIPDLETVNIQDCHSVIDNNNNIEENFNESALFFDSTYSYKGREPSTGLETMNIQVCHICDRNVSDLKKHLSSFHHFRTSTLEVFDKNGNNGKNTYQTSPIGNATNSYESPEHSSGE
ncbi:hypothetical protein WA026_022935 [Henosepilachna vigintioctopunctata]|uniref:C2H2-type domain-containing protein n=1 Tax=Henosepilachna vigintioctopunctata TaxID=420089 RepID=A0AAW1TXT8_9CUCU